MQLVHAPGTHRVRADFHVKVQPNPPEHGISFRGHNYPAKKIDGQWVVELPEHIPMPDGQIKPLTDAEIDQLASHGLVPKQHIASGFSVEAAVAAVAGTTNVNDVLAQERAIREEMAAGKATGTMTLETPESPKAASASKKKPGEL